VLAPLGRGGGYEGRSDWPQASTSVVHAIPAGGCEVHDAARREGDIESLDAHGERGRGEGHRVISHERHLVLVHLEEVGAAAPGGHVGEGAWDAESIGLDAEEEGVEIAVDGA